ncbi:RNA dependent RNA polymerase [Metabacillus fastidiosus]|uniref:RNA dependent RNA polymerase n=1 Tax=Metabacillus fastidiosus TaxID=1458 RepID=UPI003D2B6A26
MIKQIFYTYKFKSSRLKEFNYNIEKLTFEEAKSNKEVINTFDSQLLRSIRDIKKKKINYKQLNDFKNQLECIKKQEHSDENAKKIDNLQRKIDSILFVPEIISIVMENKEHYRYLFRNGLRLNNKVYRRLTCSAGQARSSTVIFCETSVADKLDVIFDNGRDTKKELVPSKFNAYKGLATSATTVVSTPRFCLVPDYYSPTEVKVNFVKETDLNKDDDIEVKTITEMFNRFDGQGIISVEQAKKWADELDLDYIPSQWCFRQNYVKGMLSTFDIKAFCDEINNKNYMIRTSYLDENGKNKLADLRKVDVILSESQFKLWDSFPSMEAYQENCKNNNLQWGISLVSPKKDKDILKMNYQFLQTLNLGDKDIEKVCSKFVNWITGVTSKDIYYTLLFLLGTDIDEDKIINYLENSDNHWIKALMLDNKLIHDKWIKKKIYDLVKKKIKNGCLGQIFVDGNFQVLVSDPYAMMQHICSLEVTGLLNKNEHYSHYWNDKDVKVVDSMRAPLTYRSEHVLLNLKQNEKMDYWYRYNTTGIIVNIHGHETMNWAGSDFDFDIIATTSDKYIVKGVYQNELPITYEPPSSEKTKLTERKLYNADLHSFGSEIGQITNKSTSGYALLAQLESSSKEYETTLRRIQMCTKLQSAQIDKAKIGRKVKSIPNIWVKYNRINEFDSNESKENKQFLNDTLLNKHPYFFTYLYGGTRVKYKNYYNNQDITCRQRFGMSLEELKKLNRKTTEQLEFLNLFEQYSPVIDSDCVMNKICRYIESVDFGIKNIIKQDSYEIDYSHLMSVNSFTLDENKYKKIKKAYDKFKEQSSTLASTTSNDFTIKNGIDDEVEKNVDIVYEDLKNSLNKICSNVYELVDYLIHMFYIDKLESNKDVLWRVYGRYIIDNLKSKINKITLPIPSDDGDYDYLNMKYKLIEVDLINE